MALVVDQDARQAPPFRAGKDSAPGERGSMPRSSGSVRSLLLFDVLAHDGDRRPAAGRGEVARAP